MPIAEFVECTFPTDCTQKMSCQQNSNSTSQSSRKPRHKRRSLLDWLDKHWYSSQTEQICVNSGTVSCVRLTGKFGDAKCMFKFKPEDGLYSVQSICHCDKYFTPISTCVDAKSVPKWLVLHVYTFIFNTLLMIHIYYFIIVFY